MSVKAHFVWTTIVVSLLASATFLGPVSSVGAQEAEHDLVAARSLAAERHVVTDDSGHYIQFDQPELVIEAILDLVERAR